VLQANLEGTKIKGNVEVAVIAATMGFDALLNDGRSFGVGIFLSLAGLIQDENAQQKEKRTTHDLFFGKNTVLHPIEFKAGKRKFTIRPDADERDDIPPGTFPLKFFTQKFFLR
jgi:hypothetical protein